MRIKLILETDDFFEKVIFDANEKQILMNSNDMAVMGVHNGFYLSDLLKKASKLKIEVRDDKGNRVI